MREWFKDLGFFIRHRILRIFVICLAAYCVITMGTRVYVDKAGIADEVMETIEETVSSMDIEETDENGETYISMPKLATQNIRAGMIGLFSGLVPFILFPAIVLVENAVMMGSVLVGSDYLGITAMQILIYGVLPHGIMEIPAMIICYACGVRICITVTSLILKRQDWFETRFEVSRAVITAVLISVPLFIAAAYVESFITPDLLYRMVLAPALGLA